MQLQQMADNFFGFDTSLGAGLDDGLDSLDDEEYGEENNYDALNDETFGSEATAGDWEQDHEKLAQITESSRVRNRNDYSKSESEIDVENSLSHLVLDEKEVTIPRPGVWDSPTNLPISTPQNRTKTSLSTTLENAWTVEELERSLITSRPPPGLIKQPTVSQTQPPSGTSGRNLFLNSIASAEKLQQINGAALPPNQFSVVLPPNVRLTHPQFHLQNVRPLPNQPANMLRYPLPPPHLLMAPGGQRQTLHSNFPLNNFPHPPNPGMGHIPYIPQEHPLIQPYTNNHQSMQHNMHIGNQRNQNKQFNHNERQENHQLHFRNNQYHQNQNHLNRYNHNQVHQGHPIHSHLMNHHHNHLSSNGIGPSGEHDEYAGLMNNREKQWLNNIQLLQLNTNQPYIDDYYYTVFCDRLNKKNENKNKNDDSKKISNGKGNTNNNNNNNNGHHRDPRDRDQPQHTFTKVATTPMQFENSLGKLQYSSVTAPRKIIDMDVVANSDQQASSLQQKDTKKTRQLLLEIERLYMLLLKLEDKSNPLAVLADLQREQQQREQQHQQQQESGEAITEPEYRDPIKEKEELTASIMTSLLLLAQEDKFTNLLRFRKGKMLFLRFLACVDVKEHTLKLAKLWGGVIKGLSIIGRRDSQHLLTSFYTEFRKWTEENKENTLILTHLVKEFIEASAQPRTQKSDSVANSLKFALTNKFGISVIALVLKYGMGLCYILVLEYDSFIEQWKLFLQCLSRELRSTRDELKVKPYDLLNEGALKEHLRKVLNEEVYDLSVEADFILFFT